MELVHKGDLKSEFQEQIIIELDRSRSKMREVLAAKAKQYVS